MRRLLLVATLAASALVAPPPARSAPLEVRDGTAYAVLDQGEARVGNEHAERVFRWDGDGLRTTSLYDKRTGIEWAAGGGSNDFTLGRGPVAVTSRGWIAASKTASPMPRGGVVLRLRLTNPAQPFVLVREIEVLPGVAGFSTRTTIESVTPFELDSYTLDEITSGVAGLTAHAVDMRGGADWRDNTGYDYRADALPDAAGVTAEWMDVTASSNPAHPGFALLTERRNYHSSVMRFDGARAAAAVDTSRDLQYLGPFEPGSAGPNPSGVARYTRKAVGPLRLERAFLALSTDPDDAPWQAYKYLRHRMTWRGPTIDFNTDKVDKGSAGRGRGAKDDADFPTVMQLLPIVERLGVETFVLDDGWMPRNGDWAPDPDRFPAGFEPLLSELARRGMRLGLWMAPGNFHPYSRTFQANPEWSCAPVGTATGAANLGDPEGALVTGSAEPGVGVWNMLGRNRAGEVYADRLRADIEGLVRRYGVAKFKYDFLVWLDCANPEPVDVYQYRDAFFDRVVDPLYEAYPDVGFGLDETNDYRGFPYESILRGPTWFQNGTPGPNALLHNVWTLAPYVPGFTLGMHVLGGDSTSRFPVDYLVAVSMLYQPTIWKDVRDLVDKTDPLRAPVIETARYWFDFFKARRDELAGFAYPLLDDPLPGTSWAAMQRWDRDAQRGFLLAYRQDTGETTKVVPLRGVDPARRFRLTDETSGTLVGEYAGAELLSGVRIEIPRRHGFRIVRVSPV